MGEEICGSGVLRVAGWEVAAASVPGRPHQLAGRNNQDEVVALPLPDGFVAVVCDGCGSTKRSEVGSILGARLVAHRLASLAQNMSDYATLGIDWFWDDATHAITKDLRMLAHSLGGPPHKAALDYLLFTTVGVVVTNGYVHTFSCGDGVISVNGEVTVLEPLHGNHPAYITYRLFEAGALKDVDPAAVRFREHQRLPIAEVSSLALGTDGALDILAAADQPFPGAAFDRVGQLQTWFELDPLFQNADMLRRRLSRAGRDHVRQVDGGGVRLFPGLLKDDTTLVLARKAPV